jgi:hypothetical protein
MDTVVNAVVKAHMRKVCRTDNADAIASFVDAATAAEAMGEELPRWNPPSIPLWKGVYHLHRFVNERMAERELADAIARGWRDAGFTKKSDGQYMPIPQSCKVRPQADRRKLAAYQEGGTLGELFRVADPGPREIAARFQANCSNGTRFSGCIVGACDNRAPCVGNCYYALLLIAQDSNDDGDMDGDQGVDGECPSDDEVSAAYSMMCSSVHREMV